MEGRELKLKYSDLLQTNSSIEGVRMSAFDEIERLGQLRDQGLLTDKEFQRQKRRLLHEASIALSASPSGLSDQMHYGGYEAYAGEAPKRGCLWLLFCGPGAAIMWNRRMWPENEADAISAVHRKDNVIVQFIMTTILYLFLLYVAFAVVI